MNIVFANLAESAEDIGLVVAGILMLLLLINGIRDLVILLRAIIELPAQIIHKAICFLRRLF
jgi:hypothetical protein